MPRVHPSRSLIAGSTLVEVPLIGLSFNQESPDDARVFEPTGTLIVTAEGASSARIEVPVVRRRHFAPPRHGPRRRFRPPSTDCIPLVRRGQYSARIAMSVSRALFWHQLIAGQQNMIIAGGSRAPNQGMILWET